MTNPFMAVQHFYSCSIQYVDHIYIHLPDHKLVEIISMLVEIMEVSKVVSTYGHNKWPQLAW